MEPRQLTGGATGPGSHSWREGARTPGTVRLPSPRILSAWFLRWARGQRAWVSSVMPALKGFLSSRALIRASSLESDRPLPTLSEEGQPGSGQLASHLRGRGINAVIVSEVGAARTCVSRPSQGRLHLPFEVLCGPDPGQMANCCHPRRNQAKSKFRLRGGGSGFHRLSGT